MAYTVNITGYPNNSYGYVKINNVTKSEIVSLTYDTKPTVSVYVSSSRSTLRSSCKVTLNGTTVKSGYGTYTLDLGDADTVTIKFNQVSSGSYYYYTADITTEKSSSGGGSSVGGGHYANVNGTSYEIEGATVRVDGVNYEIDSGMTLVSGTTKEIAFVEMCTVEIVKSGSSTHNWYRIEINGVVYQQSATLELPVGTEIYTYAYGKDHTYNGTDLNAREHTFTLERDATIEIYTSGSSSSGVSGWIRITH